MRIQFVPSKNISRKVASQVRATRQDHAHSQGRILNMPKGVPRTAGKDLYVRASRDIDATCWSRTTSMCCLPKAFSRTTALYVMPFRDFEYRFTDAVVSVTSHVNSRIVVDRSPPTTGLSARWFSAKTPSLSPSGLSKVKLFLIIVLSFKARSTWRCAGTTSPY